MALSLLEKTLVQNSVAHSTGAPTNITTIYANTVPTKAKDIYAGISEKLKGTAKSKSLSLTTYGYAIV